MTDSELKALASSAGSIASSLINDDDVALRFYHAARAAIPRLLAEKEMWRGLVAEMTDPDECWYDHHGYCQAHSLDERPCPHERARAALADGEK